MSSIGVNCCVFVVSFFAFIGQSLTYDDHELKCSTTDMCPGTLVCRLDIEKCVSCSYLCDPSFKYYSGANCSDLCPGFVKPSKLPLKHQSLMSGNDIMDKNKVHGTRVVATLLQDDEHISTDFNVQLNSRESSGTVLSLGDMAAICGVIAFIIFCIGLRILTKEYPCPWFVVPKNTRPIKLDENNEELAELNV